MLHISGSHHPAFSENVFSAQTARSKLLHIGFIVTYTNKNCKHKLLYDLTGNYTDATIKTTGTKGVIFDECNIGS